MRFRVCGLGFRLGFRVKGTKPFKFKLSSEPYKPHRCAIVVRHSPLNRRRNSDRQCSDAQRLGCKPLAVC